MSYHKIEDLVEETIVFIDKLAWPTDRKRSLFFNLFAFQNLFDCSFTHFRQIDILLKNNFTYCIPIEKLFNEQDTPNLQPPSESRWLPLTINNRDAGSVYFNSADQQLYFDAGSKVWSLLKEDHELGASPLAMSTKQLLKEVLSACHTEHNGTLFAHWYAVILEDVLEDALLENSFPTWCEDEDMLDIRALAKAMDIPILFKEVKKQDRYFSFPPLSQFKGSEDIQYAFEGRFLIDLRTDLKKLAGQYQRQLKVLDRVREAKESLPEKLLLLEKEIQQRFEQKKWSYGGYILEGDNKTFIWYKDFFGDSQTVDDTFHRKLLYLYFDMDFAAIRVIYALQHGLILRWQHAQPSVHPSDFHMYRDIFPFLSDTQQRNTYFNGFGMLNYPLLETDSALLKRIQFLISCLDTAEQSYFEMLQAEFPSCFFERDLDTLLYTMENGRDDSGIIPEDIVVHSTISAKQLFAFREADLGKGERLKELFPDMSSPVMPKLRSPLSLRKSEKEHIFLRRS